MAPDQMSRLPYHQHRRYDGSHAIYSCFEQQDSQLEGPVIKKENYYTPSPATCEYAGKSTYAHGPHLFHQARLQQQPIDNLLAQADMTPLYRSPPDHSGDSPPLYLARASAADRHVTASASYLTVMPSPPTAEGFHLTAATQKTTSTNGRRDPRAGVAESRDQPFERDTATTNQARLLSRTLSPNPSVAQVRATQPENSSIVRHQQSDQALCHDQTSATYEALRHATTGSYQASVAAFPPYHQTPHIYPYTAAMSLSYETRPFPDYPQSGLMHDPHQEQDDNSIQHHRYPSPPPPLSENPYNPQPLDAATALAMEEMPELPPKDEDDAASPGRSKPIPKPDREVTKGEDGRFVCNWAGCTEEVRSFNRKCEWSKHMDKHDRPYKCPAEGCEKLPGFTYSGGLLRHQREVHNLHGGPRKQLNCPHPNCKRFSGKGFSRQENLNEHLRRVHTDAGEMQNEEETEEDGSERAGMKRKRGAVRDDGGDLRQEMARLRNENEELKRQSEMQTAQTASLMRQLQELQTLVGARLQQNQSHPHTAPQAHMM